MSGFCPGKIFQKGIDKTGLMCYNVDTTKKKRRLKYYDSLVC